MSGWWRTITPEEEEWPRGLSKIASPPHRLFVAGRPLPASEGAVAVVGTRRPTTTGVQIARDIAKSLAEASFAVVSGLALGIDAAAHRAALEKGGHTVAVLGCGIDRSFPARNARLQDEIAANGTLLSEYPAGTPPRAHHFPARNRIVAGLCTGVVVVEGGFRSGALITARYALDENRSVWAVPGSVRNPMADGPNELIRTGQAALVMDPSHIFEELAPSLVWRSQSDGDGVAPRLDDDEAFVLGAFDDGQMSPERLCRDLELEPGQLALVLARLEVRGMVVRRAGGYELGDAGVRARFSLAQGIDR